MPGRRFVAEHAAIVTARAKPALVASAWKGQNGAMPTVTQIVRRVIAPLSRTRAFRAIGPKALPPFERLLTRVTGGKVQVSGLLVPSLILSTAGARTGEQRESPLMYTPDGHGRALVAGTSFAREKHPAWTYNLMKNADAIITVKGRRLSVRATLIDDEGEREAAWQRIERQWPGYRGYERDSGRRVRIFRLQPVKELRPGE
ncbi:nitroreductase family deazaflavin-dependent oxidoreductase [Okibacterium sp. HSC-33S16]|uniref:nitroreductase family deazaflavin-dependent oxidoreductase n=1 Tax=Okibacterium sp. HSC-33S16 TaxID=2910965 RepID=UPI00209EC308|nr:nitroreductase family deazaflavin-dependent oxidoreductase [Okibacterium sp. HSC-33S16]